MSKVKKIELTEEDKIKILTQDFAKFNEEESKKLGLMVGVRLHSTENALTAILVPVRDNRTNEKTK